MFTHLFEGLLHSPENPRGIRRENIHIPSFENWTEYETLIQKHGPIELQLLGIGRNGHIGFAEPGTPFDSTTMIVDLSEVSRRDYASFWNGDLDRVPKKAITMGIQTILQAKEILLLAFGENKADAIDKTLNGPISSEVPATALRSHPNTSFILDEKAASLIHGKAVKQFINGRILLNHQFLERDLWVAEGKIISPRDRADIVIDLGGKITAPGFIDIQINGGFGCDFSRNPEKLDCVAKRLLQFGVTGFLPTVISSTPDQYRRVLSRLQPRHFGKEGASALGIHVEGPFLSPQYAGAHNPDHFQDASRFSAEEVYGDLTGVKLATVAPEIPGGMELIRFLSERGVVVSIGHSGASFEQTNQALKNGASLATHLFNAMTPYHHRKPGMIGAALIHPQFAYSLIVDQVHLSAESIVLCWRCNPQGLILISDATEALGLPNGRYHLGSFEIELDEKGVCLAGSKTIAGSNLNLNRAVRLLHSITNCTKAEALEAASLKPAQLLGLYPSKGTLEIGADADFIILSEELEVEATYVGGELAYRISA